MMTTNTSSAPLFHRRRTVDRVRLSAIAMVRRDITSRFVLAGLIGGLGMTLAAPSRAASVPVTSLGDNETADTLCTLREAIKAVNTSAAYRGCAAGNGVSDSIFLPNGTIGLSSTLPAMTAPMSIFGGGYNQTIIDGRQATAVAGLSVQSAVAMSNLSIRNFPGSAITVNAGARMTLSAATIIAGGSGTSIGGCVNNAGTFNGLSIQIEGCDGFRGGVLNNSGFTYLFGSTVLKSHTEHSLIWNTSQLTLEEVTIGANHVGEGAGAVMNFGGTVSIHDSTIAYNTNLDTRTTAASALVNSSGTMSITTSVLFGNSGGSRQCLGTISSGGYNAFDSASTCTTFATGDRSVTNAMLQPLAGPEPGNYVNLPRAAGGVGRVYLPAVNSPLLRQANTGFSGISDQRGVGRRLEGSADIGSVERGNALLVVGNTTLSAGDAILKAQLEGLGFVVTVVLDSASAAANATGKILVVISESVGSTNVNSKFRDVSAGVLVLEPSVLDDMMMTTAANLGAVNATTARVTGLFTAGFSGDTLLVNSTASFGWGTPASNANRFVYQAGTNSQFGFGYDAFSPMVSGVTSAGFRAFFFATNAAVPLLNSNGLRLLQEAMLWASQQP